MATPEQISHYKIIKKIGAGGMGEVYLAEDKRLGRKIAVKLLPQHFIEDKERLQRFEQEARAISSLNHPNILTIYEIGEADALSFLATEFIDGETLHQRMARAPLSISEVLDFAIQTAAALAAAHAAGIIHRDIKPENIMLRSDGYVKVLDFGLAKLTESNKYRSAGSAASTVPRVDTGSGSVMGTIGYMSPEQLRRLKLDGRTDIWSLGVILYEMIAGRAPFAGSTESDVIASILDREAPPLIRYAPALPSELARIVTKALRKDRDERYQSVKDMFIDLRSLKQTLEFEAKLESTGRTDEKFTPVTNANQSEGTNQRKARSTSIIQIIALKVRRRKVAATFILLVVAATAILGSYRLFGRQGALRSRRVPFESCESLKMPYTDKAIRIAISPDGSHIAFVEKEGEKQSIVYQPIAPTSDAQRDQPGRIVPPAEGDTYGLTFSRDGEYIYYIRFREDQTALLYRVHVLESIPRKLIEKVDSPVTLSPDGTQLAFIRKYPDEGKEELIIANAEDGEQERTLAASRRPDFFTTIIGPEWSPDGKVIAIGVGNATQNEYRGLVAVRVADGSQSLISPQQWDSIGRFGWLADGSGLIVPAAHRLKGRAKQLWYIPYPRGKARQLTVGTSNYIGVSLTKDARTLAAMQSDTFSHFWVVPSGDSSRARMITSGMFAGRDPSLMPDGRILFVSSTSGNEDIWVMDADGGNQTQLTFDPNYDVSPMATRDGRYIVFTSERKGSFDVWRMDIDGRNLKQLTFNSDASSPSCSPDGKWVVYSGSDGSGIDTLWKVPIDGGEPVRLTNKPARSPVVSPDGRMVACVYWDEQAGGYKTGILSIEGGEFEKSFDVVPENMGWRHDSRALLYLSIRNDTQNLFAQPLDGNRPKKLTDFKELEIYSFDSSHDGRVLVCERGNKRTNAVLIKDLR